MAREWRVGVDVGGTFTDLVAYNPRSGEVRRAKVLTAPREPWRGVIAALEASRLGPMDVGLLVHASTIGTNALLGQVGLELPRAWLVATRGFEDVVEIARQNRPSLYDPRARRPQPLVPRERRLGIAARLGPGGEVLGEPGPRELDEAAERIRRDAEEHGPGRVVVVVSVLHCYTDPGFEERVADELGRRLPSGVVVEASCAVDPEPGEYERTSTALVNAVLRPVYGWYIDRLRGELAARGYRAPLLVMQSSGGVAPPELASARPVRFIESGPAAGAVAAALAARHLGLPLAVGFDMGGTTAKAVLIERGSPRLSSLFEVGGRSHHGRLVRGTGYPVRAPHIDLVEVSAGGGTIAWVDAGGALRLGPISAGADPGPACYGRGGRDPTVTDAHLLLGRLPRVLAGGLLRLDEAAAREAYRRIAGALGVSVEEAAAAVIEQANTVMARAVRMVTVERGVEPEEAALIAYGGAGPLHAAELAEETGMKRVIVPPAPGVYSALGLVAADHRLDLHRGVHRPLDEVDARIVEELRGEMLEEAARILGEVDSAVLIAEIRPSGMEEAVETPWAPDREALVEAFRREYRRRHGYLPPRLPPLVLSRLHLVAVRTGEKPRLAGLRATGRPVGTREAYIQPTGWEEAEVYRGGPPREATGSLIVEEQDTTIIVPRGWRLRLDQATAAIIL